ncbi:ABC transporter permease [Streptomyces sp. AK02-01A]|uniref:ABC transporter permease n=1 Tax=Streptomyces sp. AK02-01A TaxID=3028648 RepID=UPI0029A619FB|nr:ABC transporter permease [Streptomyces sp. AK02-01A]MDX3853740.1 ABC transporter permease [Streptomyces sp. AK02-01A]
MRLFVIATRYGLIEHARNRFAMLLVALFIPAWVSLVRLAISDDPVRFRLQATGGDLVANGNQLTQITGALNAVTLIVGFMMFAATFSSGAFDRRLSMAGYHRVPLGLAKVACLGLSSAVVAVYATVVICFQWSPRQPALLAVALFCAATTYGALGVALGTLLRREVEGMFAIVMISVVDLALQNPVASSGANDGIVRWLPSYGAMQASVAASFSAGTPLGYFAVQLAWFAASALVGLLAFRRRTRSALRGGARLHQWMPGRRVPEQSRQAAEY